MLDTYEASQLFRQSYGRGMIVFIYGLLWLVAALAGYIWLDPLLASGSGLGTALLIATWTSALAGGIGGATAMLTRLYKHVSIEQNFQHQSLSAYLLQPVIGVGVGIAVLYVVAIPGAFMMNLIISRDFLFQATGAPSILASVQVVFERIMAVFEEVLASPTFVALQMLFGWVGGFYQRQGLQKIKSLTQSRKPIEQGPHSIDQDSPLFYKEWVRYRRQLARWSYTWGLFVFFYGLAWLIGLLFSYLMTIDWLATLEGNSQTAGATLMLAAWPTAVAGGIGGAFSLFKELFEHVSVKKDFHPQHLMSYLAQPIIGFVLGLVMYLLFAGGYLVILNNDGSLMAIETGAVFMLQLLLGWIVGFRQQTVTDFIQRLIYDVVAFFKQVGRKVMSNPTGWFKKAERDKRLGEIAEEQERSVFSSIDPDDPPGWIWRRGG